MRPYSTACARARAFIAMKVCRAPLVAKRPETPLKLEIAMLVSTEPTMSTTTSSMIEKPDLRLSIFRFRSLRRWEEPRWTIREIRAMRESQQTRAFFPGAVSDSDTLFPAPGKECPERKLPKDGGKRRKTAGISVETGAAVRRLRGPPSTCQMRSTYASAIMLE